MKVGNRVKEYKPNDQYYTPSWIFEQMNIEFDLDVAAPEGGIDWIPAKHYFDESTDGLAKDWFGRVWMNPPFSKQRPWIEKFVDHKNGVALLPWSKSKSLMAIWNEADAITMLPATLRFEHKTDGLKGIFVACGLFAFGSDCVKAINKLENKVR